jgi:hypothetical protein
MQGVASSPNVQVEYRPIRRSRTREGDLLADATDRGVHGFVGCCGRDERLARYLIPAEVGSGPGAA